jgi:transcriptional regulator with GAF, ATPase, and Fis domain
LSADEWSWPGNLRQLEAAIQRARLRALAIDRDATAIDAAHLEGRDLGGPRTVAPAHDLGEAWGRLQAQQAEIAARQDELIELAMERHGGVVARAAQELGLPRTSLVGRLQARGKDR